MIQIKVNGPNKRTIIDSLRCQLKLQKQNDKIQLLRFKSLPIKNHKNQNKYRLNIPASVKLNKISNIRNSIPLTSVNTQIKKQSYLEELSNYLSQQAKQARDLTIQYRRNGGYSQENSLLRVRSNLEKQNVSKDDFHDIYDENSYYRQKKRSRNNQKYKTLEDRPLKTQQTKHQIDSTDFCIQEHSEVQDSISKYIRKHLSQDFKQKKLYKQSILKNYQTIQTTSSPKKPPSNKQYYSVDKKNDFKCQKEQSNQVDIQHRESSNQNKSHLKRKISKYDHKGIYEQIQRQYNNSRYNSSKNKQNLQKQEFNHYQLMQKLFKGQLHPEMCKIQKQRPMIQVSNCLHIREDKQQNERLKSHILKRIRNHEISFNGENSIYKKKKTYTNKNSLEQIKRNGDKKLFKIEETLFKNSFGPWRNSGFNYVI